MKNGCGLHNEEKLKVLLIVFIVFFGFFLFGNRVLATVTCGGGYECDSADGSCKSSSSCDQMIVNDASCFLNEQCLSGICYKDKFICVDKLPSSPPASTISWVNAPPSVGAPIVVEFGKTTSFTVSATEKSNGADLPASVNCKTNCDLVTMKINSDAQTEITFDSTKLGSQYQHDGALPVVQISATSKTDSNNFIVANVTFKITMPKATTGSGAYSLIQWSNDQDKNTYSIAGSNKFACAGLQDGVFDKAIPITGDMGEVGAKLESGQADVSFILGTAEGIDAVAGKCNGINFYVELRMKVKKDLNGISWQSCKDYVSKDECLRNFLIAIKEDTHSHQACFCSSDNGYTKAKCMPNDNKSCQTYLDKDYVKCELKASDECLAGVAKAVQKDVQNYDPKKNEIEESAKSGFDYLGTNDVSVIIGRVIKAIMGIMGSVALAMFVYAGILWMTASGNSEKEEKSKTILVWSTLGVIVVFASYALLNFVFEIVK